ncbi:MAG: SagB/ThcOx family dehydrogenase [Rikenellaceae bacterium]|nr:SagB/ThcOx family dehydrogenase [Rikenellaceae bacterium]
MKKAILTFAVTAVIFSAHAQEAVKLNSRSEVRGTSVMEALANRQSLRNYRETELSAQDLSDLLWAAVGVNRDNGKRTAPTAQNSQDVDVYLCNKDGVYLYDAPENLLRLVINDDIRTLIEGNRPTGAPVILLIVANMSRYNGYKPDGDNKHYYEMGAVDAGIVSQNISLFCAGIGLGTVPRASMNHDGIRKALALTDTQILWLNHPVAYLATE